MLCAEGLFEPSAGLRRYLDLWPPSAADPVRLLFGVRRTPLPAGLAGPYVEIGTFMPGRGLRDVPDLTYERYSYSQICGSLTSGRLRLDALIAVGGGPAASGARSLGVVNGYLQLAGEMARTIVLEEMADLPSVPGAATVRPPDAVIPAPPAPGFRGLSAAPDPISRRIAAHVASLLPPRCTLSLGVGKVPDALAEECRDMKGLRLVSGALADGARMLAEAGALDAAAEVIGMSVIGGPEVIDWAATDPRVRLLPSTLVHDPGWLSGRERLVTVLGALNVDGAGNANAERVAGRLVSGLGGAPDLAAGAAASPGGLCVIALPSTSRSGKSALVDSLETVTVETRHVGAVVTENGAAVKGASTRRWRADLERIF
ncbi:4-hydroxybutyrate CoA-transferase [Acrocarpospora pleiomorpha]|uniref:4-hydroxybutyrate CoA-transferase n=1 Tax=Acrocarpospora pleiomorpha TaxID=90975 RepID=A0A5M3XI48_9ACTN|nr:4-hydroxybutyrate CoA-transferase [Acrocarpospora pleiomorpha]